jgi:uncharacterized membrane protein
VVTAARTSAGARAARIVVALFVVVVSAGFTACDAFETGCNWTAMRADAIVNPDGSMDVVEHVTYEFHGTCHGGIRTIPPRGNPAAEDTLGTPDYAIDKITVTERGEPVPIDSSSFGYVRWGDANVEVSGTHTYDLSYHVEDAVVVAEDTAVLYWVFVGDGFPAMDPAEVTIQTPGPSAPQAFAHGILDGVIDPVTGPTVHLAAKHNPAGTLIEARLLMPTSEFTVAPTTGPLKQAILDTETGYADEANAKRAEYRQEIEDKANRRKVGNVLGPAAAGGAFLVFLAIFFKWGNEPPKPDDVGEYYREVDAMDPPAVCQAIASFGTVTNEAFSATLIDLAQRGWLTITEEGEGRKQDYRFTRTPKAEGTLSDYESKLLWKLFPNGGSITQDELVADAKKHRESSAKWMDSFKSGVQDDFDGRGYVDTGHGV